MDKAFFFGAFLSFLASCFPNVLNLKVWEISVFISPGKALRFAVGLVCMEMLYAIASLKWLTSHVEQFYPYAYFFVALITIIVAYRSSRRSVQAISISRVGNHYLLKGMLVGAGHLLSIPFWAGVTLYVQELGLVFTSDGVLYGYVLGIGTGSWLFFACVAFLSLRFPTLFKQHAETGRKRFNFLSWIYVLVAFYFIYKGLVAVFSR